MNVFRFWKIVEFYFYSSKKMNTLDILVRRISVCVLFCLQVVVKEMGAFVHSHPEGSGHI